MTHPLSLRQPNSPHQPATPPSWNPYAFSEPNPRVIADETRFQFADTRKQVEMLQSTIASLIRRIEESEARTSRQIIELEASIRHFAGQNSRIRWNPNQQGRTYHNYFSPPNSPIRLPPFVPPSPAPTVHSEFSSASSDLEQNTELPTWLNHPTVQYPYHDYIDLTTSQPHSLMDEESYTSSRVIKSLPMDHNPEALIYSPFGSPGDNHLNDAQRAKLSERLLCQTDDETMGLVGLEYDDHPIVLGGLNEPLIEGRFPDETNLHAAFVFRAQRWGTNTDICLYRLPRRELLLPSDSSPSDSTLARRRHTWSITYRIWYQFVQSVGPSRFPGLVDDNWVTILDAPPEETRALFSKVLGSYTGYRGTDSQNSTRPYHLPTIIPDLLTSFDDAVKQPWPVRLSLSDLIVDLDDFAAQRDIETRDAAKLWRGVLWNNFPKHCTKHLRLSSYGGDDGRWTMTHAEFRDRLTRRRKLWQEVSHHRFPNGSYLPQAIDNRVCDQDQKLRQLVSESYAFSRILVSWREGTIHLKYAVLPFLSELVKDDAPLDGVWLQKWLDLVQIIQRFYDSKRGMRSSGVTDLGSGGESRRLNAT